MNDTKQRIASLSRNLTIDITREKKFLRVPVVQDYFRGRRDLTIDVIASLQAILADSDLDSAEKGCEGSVQDAEGL